MRIDRMLSIVVILLNRRKITAKELSDRFEVSLRTIYRDIDAINLAGIPIISNQGTGGGYEIPENYKLNKQYLSISDMRSILSALKGINAALDDKDIKNIFEKVQSLLPENIKKNFHKGDEVIVFDTIGWGNDDRSAKKIQILYDAIKKRNEIQIKYVDTHGNSSERIIEPMTLIQKGFSWYLFGFCQKRKALRLFKLTRIKKIDLLDIVFNRKIEDYRKTAAAWHSSPIENIEVILKFDSKLKHLVDDYHDSSQIISSDNNSIVIKTNYPCGEWLMGMILSHGNAIEVISPLSLRQEVCQRIEKMAQLYKNQVYKKNP